MLDRFLAAGISRESFDAHLAAGRIVVAGERVTDPATPAAKPAAVWIALDPRDGAREADSAPADDQRIIGRVDWQHG